MPIKPITEDIVHGSPTTAIYMIQDKINEIAEYLNTKEEREQSQLTATLNLLGNFGRGDG